MFTHLGVGADADAAVHAAVNTTANTAVKAAGSAVASAAASAPVRLVGDAAVLAGDAAILAGNAAASAVAVQKSTPNDLCVAVENFEELCRALSLSVWSSDVGEASLRRGCRCAPRRTLTLGASHHKTGTLLLERLLQAFAVEVEVPFQKPTWHGCVALARIEPAVCFEEHASLRRLTNTWARPAAAVAALRPKLIHVVREPLEVCVSAYQYHLHAAEPWLRTPKPEYQGIGWQAVLRARDVRVGLLLECKRSVRDQIAQQAETFNATRRGVFATRVYTIRMEETQVDFDGAMQGLFRFLLAGDAGPAPQGSRSVHQPNGKPALAGLSLDSTAAASTYPDTRLWESSATSSSSQALVDSLVGAVRRYDVSRNRRELDDGHLSASQKKRELRSILLNHSAMAAELSFWRAAVGYDASYARFCTSYNFNFYAQAVQDGARFAGPAAATQR